MAIKRVKELVLDIYDELELLIWYQDLVKLALEQENLKHMELLLDAYKPLGDCQLVEMKWKLEAIKKELKIKD